MHPTNSQVRHSLANVLWIVVVAISTSRGDIAVDLVDLFLGLSDDFLVVGDLAEFETECCRGVLKSVSLQNSRSDHIPKMRRERASTGRDEPTPQLRPEEHLWLKRTVGPGR
jgi:hypothetical protein